MLNNYDDVVSITRRLRCSSQTPNMKWGLCSKAELVPSHFETSNTERRIIGRTRHFGSTQELRLTVAVIQSQDNCLVKGGKSTLDNWNSHVCQCILSTNCNVLSYFHDDLLHVQVLILGLRVTCTWNCCWISNDYKQTFFLKCSEVSLMLLPITS